MSDAPDEATGRPDNDAQDGSSTIYAKSTFTGEWYRVTEWEKPAGRKVIAQEKERVEEREVPQEWRDAPEERLRQVVGT